MAENTSGDRTPLCFICGEDIEEDVIQVKLNPAVQVHRKCLCPPDTVDIKVTLPAEMTAKLVEWSAEMNLSINHLASHMLYRMKKEQQQ